MARDVRQRFEDLAEKVGKGPEGHQAGSTTPPALDESYWGSFRDLFTRDVTGQGLRELLEHEVRDAFRFFARDVDFTPLRSKRWYKRYPLALRKVVHAIAYRLSPARRVFFTVAVLLLGAGWIVYVLARLERHGVSTMSTALLVAATLFFVLLVMELRDKLALKGDLEIARQIQFGLLPFEPFDHGGVSIRVAMRPANTVGGDYFDVIELGPDRLAVVVGDVAGKGMPAALLMALLQGSLRTLITAGLRGAELVAKLNAHLCANIPANRLITLLYAELDLRRGALRYVNAGHNPPFLLRRDGSVERLASTAIALGVTSEAGFESMETPLDPGDRLVLYTDGVTEAFNASDEEYGEARLEAVLRGAWASPHEALIQELVADVLAFCGRARPHDDMTLLVLGRDA